MFEIYSRFNAVSRQKHKCISECTGVHFFKETASCVLEFPSCNFALLFVIEVSEFSLGSFFRRSNVLSNCVLGLLRRPFIFNSPSFRFALERESVRRVERGHRRHRLYPRSMPANSYDAKSLVDRTWAGEETSGTALDGEGVCRARANRGIDSSRGLTRRRRRRTLGAKGMRAHRLRGREALIDQHRCPVASMLFFLFA